MNRRRFLELLPSIPYLGSALLSSGCLPEPTWRKSWQDAHRKQQGAQEGQGAAAPPPEPPVAAPAAPPDPAPGSPPEPPESLAAPVLPAAPELPSDVYPSASRLPEDPRPFVRDVARIQTEIERKLIDAEQAALDPFSDQWSVPRKAGIQDDTNIGRAVLRLEEHYLPLAEKKDNPFPAALKKLEEILGDTVQIAAAVQIHPVSPDNLLIGLPRIFHDRGYQSSGPNDTLFSRALTTLPALDLETIALLYFSTTHHLGVQVEGVRTPVIWQGIPGKYGPGGFLVRSGKGNYNPFSAVYESDDAIIRNGVIADAAIEQGTYLRPLGKEAILSNALRRIGLAREQSYGDLGGAEGLLHSALWLDPSNVKVHFSFAKLYSKTKTSASHAHAIAHLNILLQKDPRFYHGYEFRANLYQENGITDLAEADQQTMRELYHPGHPKFYTPKREE